MRKIIVILFLAIACIMVRSQTGAQTPQPEPQPGKPIVITTRYEEHRFIATPVTTDNVTMSLFTDSAGALFLYEDAITRFHLSTDGVGDNKLVTLPTFKPDAMIPAALGRRGDPRFFINPRDAGDLGKLAAKEDGVLGQQWFAGRVWTFDYPNKTLLWRAASDLPQHDKEHELKLGFKTAPSGRRINNFARIPIEVDGETIDFVLDTGASNYLSESALKQIGDGRPAARATSFLVRSLFEKWKKAHPDWRALDNFPTLTGTAKAMIEVPKVKIGGFTVGPVWFTVQTDQGFHKAWAELMDKVPDGALGGSALHYFRMTVDWPNAIAVFERP